MLVTFLSREVYFLGARCFCPRFYGLLFRFSSHSFNETSLKLDEPMPFRPKVLVFVEFSGPNATCRKTSISGC